MYVAYFDEVKAMPEHGRDHYLVGGLAVPADRIGELEEELTDVSMEFFGTAELTVETEFHASCCYFGKANYKGWKPAERIELIVRLAKIIGKCENVKRVFSAINKSHLHREEDIAKFAFAHFVERLERAVPNESSCILVGDLDDEQARNMAMDFSRFRQTGTPWEYGISLRSVVGGVYFCHSHHSRLLQLADIYMFIVSGNFGGRSGWMKELLSKSLTGTNLYAHRYKVWPN